MNFIVRIFKNSNYLSRATISTSIAAYFSLDTSFAWSWLYYNKIYDIIDFHQEDIFFSLSIPLGISKLETSRKEEKRKRKEDLSKTSFSISRPKIGDSSLPSPLLFSRKARDKEQENGERESTRGRSKVWPCPALPQRGFATKGNYGPNNHFHPAVICIIPDTLGATIVSTCRPPRPLTTITPQIGKTSR